jgi:hypothetical protein
MIGERLVSKLVNNREREIPIYLEVQLATKKPPDDDVHSGESERESKQICDLQ